MRPKAAALLLAGALLAGCGGGATSSSPSEASSSATTAAPSASQGAEGASSKRKGRRATPYRGGEKSIEDYGSEAAGSDRLALLAVFHGYLGAIADRDYPAACSHLAATVQRSLEQLATGQSKRLNCAAILPRLLSPTAAGIAREQASGRVTKVRVRGSRAFVVYHAPGAKLYMLAMSREGGEWRAALLAGSVLVPSAATLDE